jgi:hypothetical protein
MSDLTPEEIAELRKQGDFRDYLRHITGRTVAPEAPAMPALTAVPAAGYRIAHTGGWPLGTASTGPTPPPDACTCARCGGNPNSTTTHRQIGDAA